MNVRNSLSRPSRAAVPKIRRALMIFIDIKNDISHDQQEDVWYVNNDLS